MMPAMGPERYRYSAQHLWVNRIGRITRVGLTDHAQREIGEVLFVTLPEVDDELERHETFAEVESNRTTSELVSPVSGTVVAVNEDLQEAPGAVNEDPYGRGWLLEVELRDPAELDDLLSAEAYHASVPDDGEDDDR